MLLKAKVLQQSGKAGPRCLKIDLEHPPPNGCDCSQVRVLRLADSKSELGCLLFFLGE